MNCISLALGLLYITRMMSTFKENIRAKLAKAPAHTSSILTVGVVVVLVFAKTVAYAYSGSSAVLSALIDSLSDVGLSIMTLLSIKWSLKPADDDHRYGHGKIEGVSALLQAAFLIGGGSFLFMEACDRFLHPQPITAHLFTLFMMAIATLLSGVLSYLQGLGADHHESLALEADSLHYATDIWINGAVFVLVLVDYMQIAPLWLDPLCALLVAGLMARAAWFIALKAFAMLMDQELSEDIKSRMLAVIRSHPEVMGVHDLRAIQSGMRKHVSFDIEVDPNLLLWSAHEISRSVEKALLAEFPLAEIMIHIDPYGDTEDSRHDNTRC